jgi:hypothetical protein
MARVIHISESHHWYADGGEPVFEVPSADGKSKIEPTVREARKFGLLPGATAVNKQLSNPFLETWKEENSIRNAYNARPKEGESQDEYVKRISWLSGQASRDAADAGKLIHKDIEDFFLESKYPVSAASQRTVDTISKWLHNEGYVKFKPEASFGVRECGWGGRVDLLAHRADGSSAILDFKTCDISKLKVPYDSWGWQLAAYKRGLGLEDTSRLVSVPIDRGSGETKFMEWDLEDHKQLLHVFSCAFEIWAVRKKYDPRTWKDTK